MMFNMARTNQGGHARAQASLALETTNNHPARPHFTPQ